MMEIIWDGILSASMIEKVGISLSIIALATAILALRVATKQLDRQMESHLYPAFKREFPSAILISNGGPGVARNIRIEHEPGNPVFRLHTGNMVCKELPANQQCDVCVLADSRTDRKSRKCRIIWDDDRKRGKCMDFEF